MGWTLPASGTVRLQWNCVDWYGRYCNTAARFPGLSPATSSDSSFFWRIFLPMEFLLRCSALRDQMSETYLIRGGCLPSQLLCLSQPPGFLSHHGRGSGFLRAWLHQSLIQHLHLADETCPPSLCWLWRHEGRVDSSEVGIYHADICNESCLHVTDLANPLPFPWKTTRSPANVQALTRRRKALRQCPSHLPPLETWNICTVRCLSSRFFIIFSFSFFPFQHGTEMRIQPL